MELRLKVTKPFMFRWVPTPKGLPVLLNLGVFKTPKLFLNISCNVLGRLVPSFHCKRAWTPPEQAWGSTPWCRHCCSMGLHLHLSQLAWSHHSQKCKDRGSIVPVQITAVAARLTSSCSIFSSDCYIPQQPQLLQFLLLQIQKSIHFACSRY